jgi:hypothetical protein
MEWTCSKNESGEGYLRQYLRVNRWEVEEREDLDGNGWKNVEKDLQEIKVKRRRQKAVEREEWASVIKESKAVRGL